MTTQQAIQLGVCPDDVRVTSWSGKYGGQWVVWVSDAERGRMVLTQFGRDNPFGAMRWVASLRREAAGT